MCATCTLRPLSPNTSTSCVRFSAAADLRRSSRASTATEAVFSRIALTELLRYKYQPGLAAAIVAAGGPLTSLQLRRPPSWSCYGIITETSIGGLLLAGFIPGVISALLYSATILCRFYFNPSLDEPTVGVTWHERWVTLPEVAPIVMVICVVIGGMYTGWATPTEVGALGAFIIFVMALLRRMMSGKALMKSLIDTATMSDLRVSYLSASLARLDARRPRHRAVVLFGSAPVGLNFTSVAGVRLTFRYNISAAFGRS